MNMVKIAWIDDDYDVLGDMIAPLGKEPERYLVRKYRGVNEARAAMAEVLDADLVLLDILGPAPEGSTAPEQRRPGLQFLRDLREQGFTRTVVIFSVLGASEELPQAVAPYHVARVLRKGILPLDLKQALDEVLAQRAAN